MMTTNPPPPGTAGPDPPSPPPQGQASPRSGSLSPLAKVLLFIGLPVLVILIGIGAALTFWVTPVSLNYTADGRSTVAVTVPNARFHVLPSTDDNVHVAVTGWRSGAEPELVVGTTGDATTIQGGCVNMWFSRCAIDVTVSAPRTANLMLTSTNGAVTVSDRTGFATIETTNGRIDAQNLSGRLNLRTTNGAIRATGCDSDDVVARTTNGAVDLDFTEAPTTVEAASTNGSISVRVPDTVTYSVEARTVNGQVDTNDLGSDPQSERTITAETVNGSITVKPARG